jgi:DNA-binding LacI/PurR family transcriptional regulator
MLTPRQKLRIRVLSGVADDTLTKYLRDRASVREASRLRIEAAARTEGIALPLQQSVSNPPDAVRVA